MRGPCVYSAAMPKHLVIVESPAKARTIERYLGPDYRVLASYGHVRDLPDNPGKGKFGVDVEHGFAPEYVISDDRRKQVADIEKAAKSADTVYLATDLDREGEAIAWHVAEAAHVPDSKTRRVTFSEITERAIKEAFAQPARHRHEPRRRAAGAPDRRPPRRLHAQPAAVAQGPRRPVGRAACSPWPSAWSSSGSARSTPSSRGSTGPSARCSRRRAGDEFEAELVKIDGKPIDVGQRHRRRAPRRDAPRPQAAGHRDRDEDPEAQPGAAVHDLDPPAGGQPQARLQPEADDVDRPAAVRGRRRRRMGTSA